MTARAILSVAIAMGTLTAPLAARAQSIGAIGGEVTDRHGAPLPAAHVDVIDRVTGNERSIAADGDGYYVVRGLSADHTYSVSARCIGFLPRTVPSVLPSASGALTADISLDPVGRGAVRTAMRQ
jgi:hypothetical protein